MANETQARIDVLRRAAIVQRARSGDAPDPEGACHMADLLDRAAGSLKADPLARLFSDVRAALTIARAILADTCAKRIETSAVGSVCGRRRDHDARCGAPVAAMPGMPGVAA